MPYLDEEKKPLLYIDLLGFSRFIMENRLVDVYGKYTTLKHIQIMPAIQFKKNVKGLIISDSILFWVETDNKSWLH